MALLKVMVGQGSLSMREVARRAGRDVKAVHGDLTLLLEAGVIDRTEGGVVFPYDRIHVDYVLDAAA
jgi:predicted transcriptional regulator